jgi:transposase
MKNIEHMNLPVDLQFSLQMLFEQWRFCTRQLVAIRKHYKTKRPELAKLEEVYRSAPGVGEISARTLASELGDMSRFPNEGSLFSYTGLTPSERSSGEKVHRGHISRQGASRIRRILVEVAWRAIEQDEALRLIFDRVAQRAGHKKALVGIARRLIGRIRACFRQQMPYAIGTIG